MAEASQFGFELAEVAELLVKRQGLHEGRWVLGIEFGLGSANFGASPAEAKPAGIVLISRLVLTRAGSEVPEGIPYVVDAAKVNPVSVREGKRKSGKVEKK